MKCLYSLVASLAVIAGCAANPVPEESWRIVIGDREGKLSVLSLNSRELFSPRPRFTLTAAPSGGLHNCITGWLDPDSKMLATVDDDDTLMSTYVRVYDSKSELVAQHHSEDGWRYASCPAVLPGGRQVVFVNGNLQVVLGTLEGKRVEWKSLGKVVNVSRNRHIELIGDDSVAIGGYDSIYVLNLRNGSQREFSDGTLLGAVGGMPVSVRHRGDIVVLDLNGNIIRNLGHRVLPEYGGCWVNRVSPDGQFVAYESPSLLFGTALVFEHLGTGRKAYIRGLKTPICMGSWHATSKPADTE